jgi:hypothetical protein
MAPGDLGFMSRARGFEFPGSGGGGGGGGGGARGAAAAAGAAASATMALARQGHAGQFSERGHTGGGRNNTASNTAGNGVELAAASTVDIYNSVDTPVGGCTS